MRYQKFYAAKDIKKGEMITEEKVRSVRPGYGIYPKYLKDPFGKRRGPDNYSEKSIE